MKFSRLWLKQGILQDCRWKSSEYYISQFSDEYLLKKCLFSTLKTFQINFHEKIPI